MLGSILNAAASPKSGIETIPVKFGPRLGLQFHCVPETAKAEKYG